MLRFYWDDEPTPSVEVPLGDFFCNGWGVRCNIASQPVAVNPAGGFNSYWQMPFRQSARITIENLAPEPAPDFYYQMGYKAGTMISPADLHPANPFQIRHVRSIRAGSLVGNAAHRKLALRAAVNSMVLLKNKANLLPIAPSVRSILVVGPNAANIDVLLGNYYGPNENLTTFLHGLMVVAPRARKDTPFSAFPKRFSIVQRKWAKPDSAGRILLKAWRLFPRFPPIWLSFYRNVLRVDRCISCHSPQKIGVSYPCKNILT